MGWAGLKAVKLPYRAPTAAPDANDAARHFKDFEVVLSLFFGVTATLSLLLWKRQGKESAAAAVVVLISPLSRPQLLSHKDNSHFR